MNDQDNRVPVYFRMSPPDFQRIEDWRRAQPKIPNLSAAVRALVDRGLETFDREFTSPK